MDSPVEVAPGLEPALLERVVARLRQLEPSAVAVLVAGSYAHGTAGGHSDLVNIVTRGSPSSHYRMWFEERRGAKALHVSRSVVRAFVRDAARLAPGLLRELNDDIVVRGR